MKSHPLGLVQRSLPKRDVVVGDFHQIETSLGQKRGEFAMGYFRSD